MYSGVSQRSKGVGGVLVQVSCVQWCQSERQGSVRCTSSGQLCIVVSVRSGRCTSSGQLCIVVSVREAREWEVC